MPREETPSIPSLFWEALRIVVGDVRSSSRRLGICDSEGHPVLVFLAFGCRERVDLSEVPIVGGTPEARELVRIELEAFEEWIGPGRLQIARVVFKPVQDASALFYRAWDKIVLDSELELHDVRRIVRHELCHALDYAEDLQAEPNAPFDEYGDLLFDPVSPVLDYEENARGRRSEALARTCEIGPFGAVVLSEPCPGEPPLARELSTWASSHVWSDFALEAPWPEPGPPHATWEDPLVATEGPLEALSISPAAEPTVLMFSLAYAERGSQVTVDLHTGEFVNPPQLELGEHVTEPPAGLPVGGGFYTALGWPSGPGGALVDFPIRSLQGSWARRLLASDGGAWALVGDGCLDDSIPEAIFTADGELWFAWGDGTGVSWAPMP
jgi:hypothetical protein